MDFERKLLGDFSATENLHAVPIAVDQAAFTQGLLINDAGDGKFFQVPKIDRRVGDLEGGVVETALGDASNERHLTTLETETDAAAGAGFLALVAFAAGFAVAGAFAAAEPLNAMTRAWTGLGIVKSNGG